MKEQRSADQAEAPVTVAEVADLMDLHYPPRLALEWDQVGLAVGARRAQVSHILCAVEVTEAVLEEARGLGAELIIAHHPLLLRGVHSITADHPKGSLVIKALADQISIFVAHTNADVPDHGTSAALATVLGLLDPRPLQPTAGNELDKITTFVPADYTEQLIDALANAGAGALGDYDRCAFSVAGQGTFRPQAGAHPFLGREGEIERVTEARIEMVLPRNRRFAVLAALLQAHPYETPAYDLIPLAATDTTIGMGRIGRLAQPVTLHALAERLAAAVPRHGSGIRYSGDPDTPVSRVAVQAGAGDDLLDLARHEHADVYLTSDLRHHPATEARAWPGAPALIEIAHWAAEWLWLPVLQRVLAEQLPIPVTVSTISGDPWNGHLPTAG